MPAECTTTAKSMSRNCSADDRPPCRRARITNDLYLMDGINRSSPLGRRFRDVAGAFVAALGGEGSLTELQRADIRRATELAIISEQMRAQALQSKPVDVADLVKVEATADRARRRLGLEHREHVGFKPGGQIHSQADVSSPSPHERLAKKLDLIAERITDRVAAMAVANGADPISLGYVTSRGDGPPVIEGTPGVGGGKPKDE
jgi:hypothetical protein